jgi:hypothetical protein
MRIKEISVSSAGNISHPNPKGEKVLGFSQLKNSISIAADVDIAVEELANVYCKLAERADEAVEKHLNLRYQACLKQPKK